MMRSIKSVIAILLSVLVLGACATDPSEGPADGGSPPGGYHQH